MKNIKIGFILVCMILVACKNQPQNHKNNSDNPPIPPKPTINHTFPSAYFDKELQWLDYDPSHPGYPEPSFHHVGTGFNTLTGCQSPL